MENNSLKNLILLIQFKREGYTFGRWKNPQTFPYRSTKWKLRGDMCGKFRLLNCHKNLLIDDPCYGWPIKLEGYPQGKKGYCPRKSCFSKDFSKEQ